VACYSFLIERAEKPTAVEVLEAPEDAEKGGEHERELNDASS
jgi:hypothetical protein